MNTLCLPQAMCEQLEEQMFVMSQSLEEKDAKIALLEEELSLRQMESENLRRSLRYYSSFRCNCFSSNHYTVTFCRQFFPQGIFVTLSSLFGCCDACAPSMGSQSWFLFRYFSGIDVPYMSKHALKQQKLSNEKKKKTCPSILK